MGVHEIRFENVREQQPIDTSSHAIIRDPNKCIPVSYTHLDVYKRQALGKSGPKVRLRSVADGQQVEIPVPRIIRTVGTQKDSTAREWKDRGKQGRSQAGKSA